MCLGPSDKQTHIATKHTRQTKQIETTRQTNKTRKGPDHTKNESQGTRPRDKQKQIAMDPTTRQTKTNRKWPDHARTHREGFVFPNCMCVRLCCASSSCMLAGICIHRCRQGSALCVSELRVHCMFLSQGLEATLDRNVGSHEATFGHKT